MNIPVVSPSYKRPNATFTQGVFPDVWFAVAPEEADAYREAGHGNVWELPEGVQGNIARVRNYIHDHVYDKFECDEFVVVCDDISHIGWFEGNKPHRMTTEQVYEFIEMGFVLARDLDVKMWGMNCMGADKGSYREYTPFSCKSYISATFGGFRRLDLRYDERLPLKEDYDMCLQILNKYRRLLRINYAFYVSQLHTNKGGCASMRTMERERQQLDLLQAKWGAEIVQTDSGASSVNRVKKAAFDFNPIIKAPIGGI